MCMLCFAKSSAWSSRRGFLLASAAAAATPALAQVDVGKPEAIRKLVPAEALENSAAQQYAKVISDARAKNVLRSEGDPQLARLHAIARKLIPFATQWNPRAAQWRWQVNLIASKQINAWCMPGGKIAFYTGILDQLKLTDDEAAMIMGHEMAHALREHARERLAKSQATNIGLRLGAQLLGLGNAGDAAANIGTQLLTLKFSRSDESEADLVGLEIAARGAYLPDASVSLWKKMTAASGGSGGPAFLSTHPSGPQRIQQLQANVPKVKALYDKARRV
ncbi:MAG: M48 family metallopeptidase [Ramlibacter sp.]|nr:M48 family metallopeptidase [Ramlibacter sp.]